MGKKYSMGKKYIVEIGRLERLYKAYVNGNGKPNITRLSPEVDLTPHTAPDLEQIREDAFKNGYDAACKDIDIKSKINAAYRKGMEDAWDAARTLWNTPNRKEIFGHTTFNTVLTTLTAQEAIEKIRQYEQEKEEQIQVGDEVRNIHHGWTAVVSAIDRECMTLMDTNGKLGDGYDVNRFTKTGRHFPEIAEVLQKMMES